MQCSNIRVPLRDGEMGAYLATPDRTPAGAIVDTFSYPTGQPTPIETRWRAAGLVLTSVLLIPLVLLHKPVDHDALISALRLVAGCKGGRPA